MTRRGSVSETAPDGETHPSALGAFRPKSHAAPSTSSAAKWQAAPDACMDAILTLASERRMWGSRRSGPLPDALSIYRHANEPKAEPPRRTQALYSLHIIRVFLRAFPADL